MTVAIKLRPDLIVRTRIEVLHGVIRELAQGFGAREGTLQIIRKGILERQLLESIDLNYLNAGGKLIGRLSLKVNWRDHTFMAQSESGRTFEVDSKLSLAEQVSGVYRQLVEHTAELRSAFGVLNVDSQITYRAEIRNDEEKLKEARAFLGTSPGKVLEWAKGATGAARPDFTIHYSSERLKEFSVVIEHLKP